MEQFLHIQVVYFTITMIKKLPVLLILALIVAGCGKSVPEPAYTYPSVYKKIPDSTLEKLRKSFYQKNPYLFTSLNKFGFCGFADEQISPASPGPYALTRTQAIALVKKFILKNSSATGVKNPNVLKFTASGSRSGYDNAMYWRISSSNQKVDTLDVLYTGIRFIIKNDELYYCVGNWFPNVYVPGKIKISQEEAKALLVNKVVSHYSIAGVKWTEKISIQDLNKSVIRIKVLPVKTTDKIELRVVWQLNIPGPIYYLMSVDVETGEIVEERPTIISLGGISNNSFLSRNNIR